jgi:hypothetical protein
VLLHRFILGAQKGQIVDHINHDGLDNRKSNLRFGTKSQNTANQRLRTNNTTGFKGAYRWPGSNRWHSTIKVRQKLIHLGNFDSAVEAARAYDRAALEHFAEFAMTNKKLGLL